MSLYFLKFMWLGSSCGRKPSEADTLAFKSKKREELVAQGYRIRGNMGDQWKDLQGNHAGERTFKVPNPMYHVR